MIGTGTLINSAAIIAGGILGHFAAGFLGKSCRDSLNAVCGAGVIFIGIAGAMEGMLEIADGGIESGKSMLVILCLALGTLIGEIIGIDKGFERFGEWLKKKAGGGDDGFVNAFVTASLTVSIGAMAIIGAIKDGLQGDSSTLLVKSVIDFIIILIMASTKGLGCAFAAIPVFVFEGSITLLSRLVSPIMTDTAVSYISLIGSVLIFCIGVNILFDKKLRVANMLPSVLLAVLAAYIPWSF